MSASVDEQEIAGMYRVTVDLLAVPIILHDACFKDNMFVSMLFMDVSILHVEIIKFKAQGMF